MDSSFKGVGTKPGLSPFRADPRHSKTLTIHYPDPSSLPSSGIWHSDHSTFHFFASAAPFRPADDDELARYFGRTVPALKFLLLHDCSSSSCSSSILLFSRHLASQVELIPWKAESKCGGLQSLSSHPNPELSCFLQKGFSGITDETVGRIVHAICLKFSNNLSTFHMNTLINMYSRFGSIKIAQYLFDEMPERNEASWNTMMSGFVRVGFYTEAVNLFRKMLERDIQISGYVIASLMTACSRSECMRLEGLQIHCFLVKVGLLCDVFASTSLLNFYGIYGLAFHVNQLFGEMPERNVVSWTSLMVAYSNNGDPANVINIYKCMRHEGVACNQNTFTTVISICASVDDELLGHQVLGDVVKHGLDTNTSVANSVISMLGSFGNVEEASSIFARMIEQDTISWNSILTAYAHNQMFEHAFQYFNSMRLASYEIDAVTISTLLSISGSATNLKWGKGIHGLAVKHGLDLDLYMCNTLLTMYGGVGRIEDAEILFKGMIEKDLISWNSMMANYVQEGKCSDALGLLVKLFKSCGIVNFVSFTVALAACSSHEFFAEARIVHALVIIFGLNDLVVGNALVTMYGKCGVMLEAKKVFERMLEHDLVSWNAFIGGHAENEDSDQAIAHFKLMRDGNILPNYITMINLLGSCSAANGIMIHGMPIHGHIIRTGFGSDEYVKNSLLTMYAKCGDLNSSNRLFNDLSKNSNVTWNAMIAANSHGGKGEEALKLFTKMQRAGIELDQFGFSATLGATADLAIQEEGQQLHSLAVKLGFDSHPHVNNAIMDMYAKCGEMDDVMKLILEPNMRSLLSWNILISAFSRNGNFNNARETFHDMLKWGLKPGHVTFVSLLSACSHAGVVDEGLAYFKSMTEEFGVSAGIEHCVCIVDLLGRSGRLFEAEAFIDKMPVPPNHFVWRSLLASCRIHGNLELGEKAAKRLINSNPSDDSAYVLYSNACAISGKWDNVENLRCKMDANNVKKQPACSWVKLRRDIVTFGIGDKSHPQADKINTKLREMRKMIKEAGHVADTSFALHDTDEEQKEHNLWNHSERLALGFGLLNTPEGSKIKIFKNLRVCGDCHSVFKYVSKIAHREIILRDPYRFHHFSSGQCSCRDYW